MTTAPGSPPDLTFRGVAAVVLAGVLGIAAAVLTGAVVYHPYLLIVFIAMPQVFLAGVALAAAIPPCRRVLPGTRGLVLAVCGLTVGALVLGMLLGLRDDGDDSILFLSFVFAVVAVLVQRLVAGRSKPSGPPATS